MFRTLLFVASSSLLVLAGCGRVEISVSDNSSPVATDDKPAVNQALAQVTPAVPDTTPATMKAKVVLETPPALALPAPSGPGAAMIRPGITQWSERDVALDSLGRIGQPAVPALMEALAHRDPRVRREAARALSYIGPEAKDAVNSLIIASKDEDASVRFMAIRALGQIGPAAKDAVPTLMQAIQ